MERSFKREVALLRLGEGEVFHGEGILAVTKALLQSGVAYIGGYQGSPISQLLDVMVQPSDLLDELGVHLETPTGEAAAAAMLGASINYPLRGAVTWKSVVGTNVASDALSNVASAGVVGGALILMVLNVIRIITLFLTRMHWPKAFDIMHIDVWQVMFILFAILLWALWASWTTKRMQRPIHAPN